MCQGCSTGHAKHERATAKERQRGKSGGEREQALSQSILKGVNGSNKKSFINDGATFQQQAPGARAPLFMAHSSFNLDLGRAAPPPPLSSPLPGH